MIEERTEQLASRHALGLLSGEETTYFEELAQNDPEIAALARELQESAALLAYAAPLVEPSPSVRAQLLSAIRGETEADAPPVAVATAHAPANRGNRNRNWIPWAIAAVLAIFAGVLVFDRSQTASELEVLRAERKETTDALTSIQARQEVAMRELTDLRTKHDSDLHEIADLRNKDQISKLRIATLSSKMNNSPATVGSVAWDGDKQKGVLTLEKIPPPGPAQDYQLWIIDPHYPQPVSGGIVHVDEHGDARIVFTVEVPIHAADKFAVSRERKGGAPNAQGPIVMMGE